MWDWVNYIWGWVGDWIGNVWAWITWLYDNLKAFAQWAYGALSNAFRWLGTGFRWVLRHLAALRHLNFSSIWAALKRAYNRLLAALAWLRKRIVDPLEAMRRQILQIYRRFFQPIIRVLDSLRVFVRFIALFNRKLAAKLDARLWSLEAKILSPITTALRRLNSISSHLGALVTALGYLDRVTLLESLRRDASLVWEVLTNPRGRIFDKPATPAPFSLREVHDNLATYLETGGGPMAPRVDAMYEQWRQAMLELE
jgi:hypothetical protein